MKGSLVSLISGSSTLHEIPIAELGKASDEQTKAPEFMRLKASSGHPTIEEEDVRNEVLAHIFDKGDPNPKRTLDFDISVSDRGKRSGFVSFPKGQRQAITNWQTIGKISFSDGVASYNGDFVIHFRHPTWRNGIAFESPERPLARRGQRFRFRP
jgi:hypothetical protein